VAAYLNGSLREKMLMKQFSLLKEFFESHPAIAKDLEYDINKIIRLLKPLYGLKQAAAAWQTRAKKLMKARGFKPLVTNNAVFFIPKKSIIVSIHVDDFLMVGFFRKKINAFVSSLRSNVTIENFSEIDWYLGIRMVKFSPRGDIRLNLEQYLEKALEFENITEGRDMATFFEPGMLAKTKPFDSVAKRVNVTRYACGSTHGSLLPPGDSRLPWKPLYT
jgi:hypothetical protein